MCSYAVQMEAQMNNYPLAQHSHSCYELQTRAVSWAYGEYTCKKRGGHLVAITSAEEQAFGNGFMRSHNPRYAVWIGLHYRYGDGHFEWSSGLSDFRLC